MADITASTLKIGDNNLILRDADAQAKVAVNTQDISSLKEDFDELDDRVTALEQGGSGSGLTEDIKQALLQIAEKVAYIDEDGQDYYDALEAALYPPADLVSISCVYTQSGTVYDTDSLDSLKSDLVVTAHMSDSTTRTVTTYALNGTLAVGTSTITVTYGGKSDTFDVTVTDSSDLPEGYTKYDYITNTTPINSASAGNYDAILTNILMSSDYSYEINLLVPSSASSVSIPSPLMGTRSGASGTKQFALFFTPSTGKLGYWYGGTDTATDITNLPLSEVLNIKVLPVGASQIYPTKATIIVNDTEYDSGATASGQTWSSWFSIFKYAISETSVITSAQRCNGAQIGEIKIKDGNTLIYHFIPCNNGTYYGVYEKINGTFYYDQTKYTNFTGGYWEV